MACTSAVSTEAMTAADEATTRAEAMEKEAKERFHPIDGAKAIVSSFNAVSGWITSDSLLCVTID